MATINSLTSSSSSTYGTNSKGIGGLASGLDTDEIIKGMTIGTRSKIAKQLQSKQLLAWQTDAFRSVSNKLISFSKKYTSYTSSTNLLSSSFYLQNQITTSGSNAGKVSVSGTSATAGSLSIISAQQAAATPIMTDRPGAKTMESGAIDPGADFSLLSGKEISFSYNGTVKTIALDAGITDINSLQANLSSKLDAAFDSGKITVGITGDKLVFNTSETAAGPLGILKITGIGSDTSSLIGLSAGDSNRLNLNEKLLDVVSSPVLNIDGSAIDLTGVSTIQDLVSKVNSSDKGVKMSYIESLDKFEFTATKGGSPIIINGNVAEKLFSATPGGEITVPASTKATMTVQYGSDINTRISLESDNNTFSLDGLTINVTESFSSGDAVKLSSKSDTTKILSTVKDMVKDYNEMVELVNTELNAKRNRNYAPLTDEQREDMSESEIKAWEEKAKTGMLFGNSDMSALSNELRNVFFSSSQSMADLEAVGISTSSSWQDNGKIIIDEEKLKAAIDTDPENIKSIFSDKMTNLNAADPTKPVVFDTTSGGVMSRLQHIMDKYTKTEGATKGIFIEKAGNLSSPLSLIKNGLLTTMNDIDTIVANLKRTLTAEQKRYQSQFTRLESVVSQLNSQSSWLSQQ